MILGLASAGGSPGVTTTALALALQWPREVVLVDCDPHTQQDVLAGFLQGARGGTGLSALAESVRSDRIDEAFLRHESLPLPGARTRARFMPGFAHLGAAEVFAPLWGVLANQFVILDGLGVDVIVDCGRIGAEALPASLLSVFDQFCFVTPSSLRGLAAGRIWWPIATEQLTSLNPGATIGAVVIGSGRPYSIREIQEHFHVPVLGDVAWAPREAQVLSEGAPPSRGFTKGALMRSAHTLGDHLFSALQSRQSRVSGQRLERVS